MPHKHNRKDSVTGKNEVKLLAEKWMQLKIINLIKQIKSVSAKKHVFFSSFVGPRFYIETYYVKLEVNCAGEQTRALMGQERRDKSGYVQH